jgi:hypothetical protein
MVVNLHNYKKGQVHFALTYTLFSLLSITKLKGMFKWSMREMKVVEKQDE